MPDPICTEEEFIALWDELKSATEIAKRLNCDLRGVHRRRRSIENRRGIQLGSYDDIARRVQEIGHDEADWSVAWDKTDGLSVLIHNPLYVGKDDLKSALEDQVEAIKSYAPKYPSIKYAKPKQPHALVVNFTDLHFGAYSLEAAADVVRRGVEDAIVRSAGYEIDQIYFVMGSDCLHVDTVHRTTTKGTPVETNGAGWAAAFKAAQMAYVDALERLVQVAPVHAIHVSGNHDELSSWTLAQVIQAWFARHKGITFDVSDEPRKHVAYGDNLLSFTHGDKVKDTDLPMVVSHEAAGLWGAARHRYIYMGHIHHNRQIKYQSIKDHPGVTLQWLRSPKPTDAWHLANGYLGSQGISTFIHAKHGGGQVATISINL